MSEKKVRLSVWIYKEDLIMIYEKMKEKYSQTMNLVFQNIDQATNAYSDKLEQEYRQSYDWENKDPEDIILDISTDTFIFHEYEMLMKHNFHMSFLSSMYQIFEQQLRSFMYRQLKNHSNAVDPGKLTDFAVNMGEIKKVYLWFDYDLDKNKYWETIQELGDLANTFKHGYGRSAKRLAKKHPKVFEINPYSHERALNINLTTNSDIVFNLEELNFDTFADTLIAFWTDFPEHLNGSYTFKE